MFPIEHFIVAAGPVIVYGFVRDRRLPPLQTLDIVFVGSQLPDLIDKPLAHQFHLLPTGRVFVHSLPIAIPICCLVGWYARKTDRPRVGGAFAFAYLSHLVADNWRVLSPPDPTLSADLLWPFRPATPRPAVPSWAGTDSINIHLWTIFSIIVVAITVYYMYQDVASQLRSDRSW